MQPAPLTEELDEHLKEVIRAVHQAVNWALPHVDDPKIVDQAIRDCKEILDVVMEGNTSAWLS
jgi:hypothetical protein